MRILIVTQRFWPENFRINDLATELVRRGHEVTVLTGWPNYPEGKVFDDYKATPEQYAQYLGVKIVRVPIIPHGSRKIVLMLNYLSYVLSASVVGAYKLRGQTVDVIFTYEPSPITVGIPAALLRKIKRAPMVFWVLDLWPETLSAVGVVRNPTVLKMVGVMVRAIYKNCDLILAQSKSFISQIRKYTCPDKRIEYFPSWSETEFDWDQVHPATEIFSEPGTFNILFAGNIGSAQDFPNILLAVKLLQKHEHIRWHIVGDGRMLRSVQSSIAKNGLQKNIIMYGRFPIERMPSFLMHADALLVTLKDEPIFAMTIPGKLQTYLSAGIPVIGMLNGEGANLINSSKIGFTCNAGDADGLAKIVLNISSMPKYSLIEMGKRGPKTIRSEFNRTQLIDRLEKWIQDLHVKGS